MFLPTHLNLFLMAHAHEMNNYGMIGREKLDTIGNGSIHEMLRG
jgi:hypothetical protein